jgi:hypothetical protein
MGKDKKWLRRRMAYPQPVFGGVELFMASKAPLLVFTGGKCLGKQEMRRRVRY